METTHRRRTNPCSTRAHYGAISATGQPRNGSVSLLRRAGTAPETGCVNYTSRGTMREVTPDTRRPRSTQISVCRSMRHWHALQRWLDANADADVVVSDELPLLERLASDYPRVTTRNYEPARTIASLWPDLMRAIDDLNREFGRRVDLPGYLLEWVQWAEGGDTSQRVFEALLMIEHFDALLKAVVHPCELTVFCEPTLIWEDDILDRVARVNGVSIHRHRSVAVRIWHALDLKMTPFLRWHVPVPMTLNLRIKRVLLVLRVVLARKRETGACAVVFLLIRAVQKHVQNAVQLMQALERRDVSSTALCWLGNPRDVVETRQSIPADHLEAYLTLGDIGREFSRFMQTSAQFRATAAAPSPHVISWCGIDLCDVLTPFILKFARYELFERLLFACALTRFLDTHEPDMVRTWGAGILFHGRALNCLLEHRSANGREAPFVFDNMVGTDYLFFPPESTGGVDLMMAPGEHDVVTAARFGADVSNRRVTGISVRSAIDEFRESFSRDASREHLGLARDTRRRLFYIPAGVARGYQSFDEQNRIAAYLQTIAVRYPDLVILIKPHPGDPDSYWADVVRGNPGFHLCDRTENPYHCVNVTDLVLTKVSTLAFEAMVFGKPVISISLDGDPRSQVTYGDPGESAELFGDLEALTDLLDSLLAGGNDSTADGHAGAFDGWAATVTARQNRFLPRKLHTAAQGTADYMAEVLLEEFSAWRTKREAVGPADDSA